MEFEMRVRKYKRMILAALMILALIRFIPVDRASAQTTALAFSPDPASIYLNASNSAVVDLVITGGVMVNAFDIEFSYDPTIVRLSSWSFGTYLKELGVVWYVNNPGYFRLACTQQAQPGANGDGILLTFTFSGKGYGSTPITFTYARLSNKDAQSTFPVTDDGQIDTLYQAGVIKNSAISGSLSLQGRNDRGNVSLRLEQGIYVQQGPYPILSTDRLAENFALTPVVMDAYLLVTLQPGYLNLDEQSNKVVALLSTPLVLPALELLAGDVDGDGEIGVLDLAGVAGVFGQSGSSLAGDVNSDGIVNARDLALVAGNFGQTSETAYAGWLP